MLTGDVVAAEERERANKDKLLTKQNEMRKVENKRSAFMEEIQKLHKENTKLEAEKEKYGLEATQANAKYYQALEQVKLKNNLITKLQKKNIDAEERLKLQQQLYEQVRSDRNLYAKNLREAYEEINELK